MVNGINNALCTLNAGVADSPIKLNKEMAVGGSKSVTGTCQQDKLGAEFTVGRS